MGLLDEAEDLADRGFAADLRGQVGDAIAHYQAALELLEADRRAHGPDAATVVLEAETSTALLALLVTDGSDEVAARVGPLLEVWDLVAEHDPTSARDETYVATMVDLARWALGAGADDVARQAHRRAAGVADDAGDGAVLATASLAADLLAHDGRVAESAAALRRAVQLVDDLGGLPGDPSRPAERLLGEASLVARYLQRAVELGEGPDALAPLHERCVERLTDGFLHALEDDDDPTIAYAVQLGVHATRLAGACGRQALVPELVGQVGEWVEVWAAGGSTLGYVYARDLDDALSGVGAVPGWPRR